MADAEKKELGMLPRNPSNDDSMASTRLDKEVDVEKSHGHLSDHEEEDAAIAKEVSSDDNRDEVAQVPQDEEAQGEELDRNVTNKSKHSVNSLSTVPNGGLKAWLQVLGSFFLFFNSWGIINTFGVYQTYYEGGLLRTSSPSDISWIGSIQASLLLLVGALTGPIYDAGYFKALVAVGSFLVVFGHMMLSLCHEWWQVLLAQAFCVGLGAGCLFLPSVALISQYFHTKVAFAMGMAASGSSLGGVLYPIILYRLLPEVGFPWATRIIGFIALATLLVPNLVMQPRVFPGERRALVDWAAFKEPAYATFTFGSLFAYSGLYAPFFYVESYALETKITNPNLAFYLLSILNAASVFGRILPNYFAQKTGPFNILIPCAALSGILTLCLIGIHNVGGIIVFCLLYGFASGSMVSLPPTVFVHLTKNRAMIGTRMGQAFTILAIGILIGTPGCGWILNSSHTFKYVWVFGGTCTLFGACMIALARMFHTNWQVAVKA